MASPRRRPLGPAAAGRLLLGGVPAWCLLGAARACTQVVVPAPSGEVVVANTVESGDFVDEHGGKFVHPTLRGERLGGGSGGGCGGDCGPSAHAAEDGRLTGHCAEFFAKYGFVGAMNEKGLVVAHHMLALSAYEAPDAGRSGICARDVEPWILASFTSVPELMAYLEWPLRMRIVADPPQVDPVTFTWGVVDAAGAAVVLEFVKGSLRVHNNTIGILTNDPTWDWHVANLNNYAGLQHTWYKANNAGLETPVVDSWYPWVTNAYDSGPPSVPAPIGHGFNLLGLPGDGSGASRFVRMFFQRAYALHSSPPRDLEGALVLAQELLNTVYKVKGTIPGRDANDPLETTPVATLSVPATREVFHRGRADMTWRRIDLSKLDFSPTAKKGHARVVSPRFYTIDVTRFLTGEGQAEPDVGMV